MDLDTTIVLHEDKQYYPEVRTGRFFGGGAEPGVSSSKQPWVLYSALRGVGGVGGISRAGCRGSWPWARVEPSGGVRRGGLGRVVRWRRCTRA
jgi:hypothetical protein